MTDCENCRDWGRTIDPVELDPPAGAGFLVQCGVCKRLTWPNLGANLPAGAASVVAAAQALRRKGTLDAIEVSGLFEYKTASVDWRKFDMEINDPLESSKKPKPGPRRRTVTDQDRRAFLKRVAKRRARKKK